jgi:hypothetical protein
LLTHVSVIQFPSRGFTVASPFAKSFKGPPIHGKKELFLTLFFLNVLVASSVTAAMGVSVVEA